MCGLLYRNTLFKKKLLANHTIYTPSATALQKKLLKSVGPGVRQDDSEKMLTSFAHCLPKPVIGVASP